MKFSEMNDIDLKKWREYDYITTKALWITKGQRHFELDSRREKPKSFHGIFIPEIPYQMMLRYTKKGEWVWDCFAGSGTTIDVGKSIRRNIIANDIISIRPDIVEADSEMFNPGRKVQMVIMHPPYFNIIRYSKKEEISGMATLFKIDKPIKEKAEDLSNAKTLKKFFEKFERIVKNVISYLDNSRILILVLGQIYLNSEIVPLGVHGMEIIRKYGFRLKGWIVKDFGETKGGESVDSRNIGLNRWRMLNQGYWEFCGDNIFVLQKQPGSKLDKKEILL